MPGATVRAISYHADVPRRRGPFRVHAVFPHSRLLIDAEGFVLSITDGDYDGPLGIRAPYLPTCAPGTEAAWQGNNLRMRNSTLSLAGAIPWAGMLEQHAWSQEMLRGHCRLLEDVARPALQLDDLSPLRAALLAGDPEAVEAAGLGLLGRGKGLTPAGDDVLVGALGGLVVLDGEDDAFHLLWHSLRPHIAHRTTSLSRTLLWYAGRRVVTQPLSAVLCTLGRSDIPAGVNGVLGVGHSSGSDMLAGVWLAATTVLEGRRSRDAALVTAT